MSFAAARTMTIGRGLVFLVVGLVCALPSACAPAKPPESGGAPGPTTGSLSAGAIRRTLIDRRPVTDLRGWETRLYLIEYGPGAVAPLHVHPAVGIGLVLEGDFESVFGDEPPVRVHENQGFVDPAGAPHRVFRNLSSDRGLRFVIAYTIRMGAEPFYPGESLPPTPP